MHYHAIYLWLEVDGAVWKAVVGWCVLGLLGWIVGVLPWRRHRKTQTQIADRLDTSTPGGLTDLVTAVNKLVERDGHEGDSRDPGTGSGLRGESPAREDGEQ
jgi:hypothetical protein